MGQSTGLSEVLITGSWLTTVTQPRQKSVGFTIWAQKSRTDFLYTLFVLLVIQIKSERGLTLKGGNSRVGR